MKKTKLALGVSALLALGFSSGCNSVRAKAAFKDGNKEYTAENFKKAIEEYTQAVELDPDFTEAYFYLGSSWQALFRPGSETPENAERIDKAIQYFQKSLETNKQANEGQKKVRTNTLAALAGIFAEPPKQDATKAFEYMQQLLQEAPNDSKNLYAIANLHEKFGQVSEAEATYRKVTELNPNDAKACSALAAFYNKTLWDGKSRFDEAISTLERCASLDANDPAGHFKVATFFWDKAFRDPLINDQQKADYADKGLGAVDTALKIKPDYWEAIVYKGLLYRVKATVAKNPRERAELLDQAATLQKMALDLRKKQQAAAGEEGAAPPAEGEAGVPAETPTTSS
jgi:tetratricopeptide (TPR) repeat protein